MTLFNDSSLVAWYPMTKGSGTTLNDYSGSNNGTFNGDPVWQKEKDGGYSIYFDGTGDYIDLGSDSSLNITSTITLCAWIKTAQILDSSAVIIVGKDGGTDTEMQYRIYLNQAGYAVGNLGSHLDSAFSTTIINDNNWHFVAMTASGGVSNIYVDGVFEDSGTAGSQTTANNPRIGNRAYNIIDFDGKIKNVMIFNRALSDNEIKALYENTYIE